MKLAMRIVILLSICIPLYARSDPYNLPTAEQVSKLAAAAWKEPVNSIDVILYKQIKDPAKSVEEFRQMFESFFDKAEGPKENLSGWALEERNRTIEMNVTRAVKEQEAGRTMKQRIRIDGYRQRTDQVIGYPKMVLLEGTPHERIRPEVLLGPNTPYEMSLVNIGDKRRGDYTSFAYYHQSKSAHIKNKRGATWKRSDVIELAELSTFFQALLGVNKGSVAEPVFVPDPDKMEALRKTGLVAGELRIVIKADPDNPDARDQIQVKSDDSPCGTVFLCDRTDYSRVYYMGACNPTTGHPLYVRQCSNFDSEGFPRNVTTIEYDLDGKLKKKRVCTIEKVELNPSIPEEVFEFKPPEGYEVIDLRPGGGYVDKSKAESEALEMLNELRSLSDLPHLTKLLKHESWRVRLMALKTISTLPIEDPETLRDIAASMLADEHNVVREQASVILQRIDSNK